MKKKSLKYLVLGCIAAALAGAMTACGESRTPDLLTPLSSPTQVEFFIAYDYDQTVWSLNWEKVENSKGYEIIVAEKGEEYFVEERAESYDLTSVLKKEGVYHLSIQAIGNGKTTENSEKVEIEINAEKVTEGLEYTYYPEIGGYEISRGEADLKGRLVLPDFYDGEEVVSIGENAFGGVRSFGGVFPQEETTGVRLPRKLKTLKEDAFFYCKNLEKVEFPTCVENIRECAFQYCGKIKSVEIPPSVKKLGERAFADCVALESVSIFGKEKGIESRAFYGCNNLKNLTVDGDIEYMGAEVFSKTKWYEDQPNGLIYFENVLYGYKGEMPVGTVITDIPSYITTIAKKAFNARENLKSIQIPDGWTKLGGENIFSFCKGLEEVILPDTMEEIPSSTFISCSALKKINTPKNLKKIEDFAFAYCDGLEEFTFNAGLQTIGECAFSNCDHLKELCFNGTTAAWSGIVKGIDWRYNVPTTVVHCTDGDVTI